MEYKYIVVLDLIYPLDTNRRAALKAVENLNQNGADKVIDRLFEKIPSRLLRPDGVIVTDDGKVSPEKWSLELHITNDRDGLDADVETLHSFKALLQKSLEAKLPKKSTDAK